MGNNTRIEKNCNEQRTLKISKAMKTNYRLKKKQNTSESQDKLGHNAINIKIRNFLIQNRFLMRYYKIITKHGWRH